MSVSRIKLKGKEIILVGTAHVSEKSVELVKETIEKEKPDAVAVELCEKRKETIRKAKKWDETEIYNVIKSGRTYLFLMQLFLSNFQRRIGEDLGVKAGSEMIAAMDIAKEKGIKVFLVDRDVQITLKRAFSMMSWLEKFRLFNDFVLGMFSGEEINEELIEKLKKKDMISELMDELSREVPSVKKVLVDERDEYIAARIKQIKAKKIVAVIGAGHLDGVKNALKKSVHDLRELEEVPKKRSFLKFFGYAVTAIFFFLIFYGFYQHGADLTVEMLWKWFIIHGVLSAIGTALAFGHPLSILAAFFASPFTALHPAIAAGWVAGAVEAKVRQPRVGDFKGLFKLNSVRDYWKNRVTRILLVIVFANIGSSLGTFIALPYMASLL